MIQGSYMGAPRWGWLLGFSLLACGGALTSESSGSVGATTVGTVGEATAGATTTGMAGFMPGSVRRFGYFFSGARKPADQIGCP